MIEVFTVGHHNDTLTIDSCEYKIEHGRYALDQLWFCLMNMLEEHCNRLYPCNLSIYRITSCKWKIECDVPLSLDVVDCNIDDRTETQNGFVITCRTKPLDRIHIPKIEDVSFALCKLQEPIIFCYMNGQCVYVADRQLSVYSEPCVRLVFNDSKPSHLPTLVALLLLFVVFIAIITIC